MLDIAKISLKDDDVWDMICEGNVKGCFQIESQLCRQWCKKLKPRNILELSDLIALVRPGCLQSRSDGKSVAQQYADRKHHREDVVYLNNALEKYLNKTLGLIIYQENIIAISRGVCDFNDGQANALRKGIAKKKADILFTLEKEFVDGAKKLGIISEEEATKIFAGIKASARYLFNKCLSPETLCETEEGNFVTISNVKIGEKIKTPKGYACVVNKHNNGVKRIYRITTESGKKIECTIDHKFLCENGEILPLYEILYKKLKIICDQDY